MPKQKSIPIVSFLEEFQALRMSKTAPPAVHPPGGRPPRIALQDIVAGLAWHVMQSSGTFAQNVKMLTGMDFADSSLSERRQHAGFSPWGEALDMILHPVATGNKHPDAFYKGFRLVGVDGTTLNIGNTPPMKCRPKTKTRRGRAAFHRISCVALCELGTHAPIALRIGRDGESEGALAADILSVLTDAYLLIADRYYGAGKWIGRISRACAAPTDSTKYLLRINKRHTVQPVRRLGDGSKIVKVLDSETGKRLEVREIRAWVRRSGRKRVKVRFWTNLLDEKKYAAKELVALYAMRWEQEISYREIKEYLHQDNILLSHTVTTAAQEIAAIFMAHAMIIRRRVAVGIRHDLPPLQISFEKTLHACRNICWLAAVAGPHIDAKIFQQIIETVDKQLADNKSGKRRKRSCPRKVRQPVNKWPRLVRNRNQKGNIQYEIVKRW
jgi:Transposase DDE domain